MRKLLACSALMLALAPAVARADKQESAIVVDGDRGLTLYLSENGEEPYPICDAPCRTPRTPGTYRVGVSKATDDAPVMAAESLEVHGPTHIRIHRASGGQTLGWLFIAGGIVVAGGAATTGALLWLLMTKPPDPRSPATGFGVGSLAIGAGAVALIVAGSMVGLAGIVQGGTLLLKPDRADFTVEN